jgi:antitoxin component YwqK of YwqJK toxin-antitoxin module
VKAAYHILILSCLIICKSTQLLSQSTSTETRIEYFDNGFVKSIGRTDSNDISKASHIGLWSEFYSTGKLKETGQYQPNSYKNCCFAGPCKIIYSYKIGDWSYYHKNGQLKAMGTYTTKKKHINTSCKGGDEIYYGLLNKTWKFFDEKGNEIELDEKAIKEMEENSYLDQYAVEINGL